MLTFRRHFRYNQVKGQFNFWAIKEGKAMYLRLQMNFDIFQPNVENRRQEIKLIFSWSHSWAVFHCVFRLLMCWFLPSLIILISNCALMLFLRRRYNNGKNNRISGERSKKRKFASWIMIKTWITYSIINYFIVNRRAPVRKACRYRTTGIITTGRRIIGKITISVTAIVLICWMPGIRLKLLVCIAIKSLWTLIVQIHLAPLTHWR